MTKYRDLFKRLDANGNGYVTKEELMQGLQEVGIAVDESKITSFIAMIDTDGDGRISQPEFEVFLNTHDPANADFKAVYEVLNNSLPLLKKTSSFANQAPLEKRVLIH